jgi:DNA-directed RNA polymerase subunit H (RpoH/RPB5)
MNDLELFQIEKSTNEVRDIVLTNIIKMLTERELLKKTNLNKNIQKLIEYKSQDSNYKINLDNLDKKSLLLKIIPKKITAVSKTFGISEFLNKYKDQHKIIIVKDITKKARQYIINNYENTEIFLEEYLMINLIENIYVPEHKILNKVEVDEFYKKYNVKKKNIPKMLSDDAVAKYYNMKPGDICRIIRPSQTSGLYVTYRLVIKGSLKK